MQQNIAITSVIDVLDFIHACKHCQAVRKTEISIKQVRCNEITVRITINLLSWYKYTNGLLPVENDTCLV